jgi:hypothetical protein
VFDQFNLAQIRLLSYQSAYLNMFMYWWKPNTPARNFYTYYVYTFKYTVYDEGTACRWLSSSCMVCTVYTLNFWESLQNMVTTNLKRITYISQEEISYFFLPLP